MEINLLTVLSKNLSPTFDSLKSIIPGLMLLAITILVSCLIGNFAVKKWNGNNCKTKLGFSLISSIITIALFCFYGLSAKTIQGIIFSQILLVASYSDIKTRECDDYLSVMIIITSFIGVAISAVPGMFIAAMFTAGIFLLVVLTISDGIGGADIKLASASVFLLGFHRGIIGLILGLLIAIIANSIKSKKSGFPMLPYLTVAFIPAFFL